MDSRLLQDIIILAVGLLILFWTTQKGVTFSKHAPLALVSLFAIGLIFAIIFAWQNKTWTLSVSMISMLLFHVVLIAEFVRGVRRR